MVLHKVQEHYGYVPRDVAFEVAARLDVPLAKIYGVTAFYHFFKLRKPGKHRIAVCMGTACYLKGDEDLIKEFETILGIGLNQTTADDQFSIEAVRCIGCCGLAPVLTVDGEVYGRVTKNQLAGVVAKYRGKVMRATDGNLATMQAGRAGGAGVDPREELRADRSGEHRGVHRARGLCRAREGALPDEAGRLKPDDVIDELRKSGLRGRGGAFVCGEETALIASIEGRRGIRSRGPRSRPFAASGASRRSSITSRRSPTSR